MSRMSDQIDFAEWLGDYRLNLCSKRENDVHMHMAQLQAISACDYLKSPPFHGLPVRRGRRVPDEQKKMIRDAGGEYLPCTSDQRASGYPFGFFVACNIFALRKLLELPFWPLVDAESLVWNCSPMRKDLKSIIDKYFRACEAQKLRIKREKDEATRARKRIKSKESSARRITKGISESSVRQMKLVAAKAFLSRATPPN